MQSSAAERHRAVYRQDTPLKCREHPIRHPGSQNGPLSAVTPLGLPDTHFKLQKRNGRQEQG
ncbi:hypothetical protein PHISP_07928 [Aspergillus sp. HF37]|uniref:Uncharacterized protein n=1 Tax=Aspergillus sclerotialis TaxID=2070753 RepID=A0A3A2Z362_9EURO|nr:hypothetical protein PHISCL_11020 [Aspergillus sclerotialis]RMJ21200.1 hypothetical protein PHISP_07928 [Aspergillus sp. HF37]